MKKLIVLLTLAIAGCANKYPQAVKDNFMASCTNGDGSKTESCKCALDKTQRNYTYEEYQQIEQSTQLGGGRLPNSYVAVVAPCLKVTP